MASTIMIGNAPCSWGTLEFEGLDARPLTHVRMLDELAETGYTGTELGDWGYMPTEPAALAAELERRGLDMTGAFVGVDLRDAGAHAAGEALAVRTAQLIAGAADRLPSAVRPFLVLADANGTDPTRTANAGRVTPEMGLDDAQWRTFAAGVERIAAAVQAAAGLLTVFHHHCAGFVETPAEIDRLLSLTDPALVGLVFDTGHFTFGAGGCDGVLAALARYAHRTWYVHFKDCDPQVMAQARAAGWDYFESVRHGVFCELGRGCVDFPAVLAWLRGRDYAGYITVEQDVLPGMGTPAASAARNREYLLGIGV